MFIWFVYIYKGFYTECLLNNLPVDFATAPIKIQGTAKNIQPNPAAIERICAFLAVL